MFRTILFTTLFFAVTAGCAQTHTEEQIKICEEKLKSFSDSSDFYLKKREQLTLLLIREQIKQYGLPKITGEGMLVNHSAMSLFYDSKHGQAKWVVHIVHPAIKEGGESRTNNFRKDSLLNERTPGRDDYLNSGYDRGHLAPSADFRWSHRALSESYYYSNISPQKPELNRIKWAQLENLIRQYVISSGEPVFVVTGGVLKDNLKTIGSDNKISVPEKFYKVIAGISGSEKKGIAFLMLNGENTKPVINYTVSIDSIEVLTGIDFFHLLPDTMENRIESAYDINKWLKAEYSGNVAPFEPEELPKGAIIAADAAGYYDKNVTVCGTVVSSKVYKDSKGVVFNLDQKFPYHIFSFTIWKKDAVNFSYDPKTTLINRKVCITGTIRKYNDKPTMDVENEKSIIFTGDEE